jgi:inositol phosphorylceramide mannosyltransferase catalytic subunit
MKTRVLVIVLLTVFLPLVYFLYIASSLIALIFDNGLAGSVTFAEIEARRNQTLASRIPNIIHQTWKNEDIPERWQIPQRAWFSTFFQTR